jgi:hypothetical protein
MPQAPGPLGFIVPSQRNQAQANAADAAAAAMPRFAMAPVGELPLGTKIMLTDFWKAPEAVADMGQEFTGFGQYTGSCVGVSEGNAVVTELCVQRMIADAPKKASIVWWPFPYGRTRANEGDRGQGEGAVDSVMGETLVKEGFFSIKEPGLPQFARNGPDGLWLTKQIEYQWSDGNAIAQKWRDLAKPQAGCVKAVVNDTMGIRTAIVNGYPILDGCDNFIGNGRIVGSGDEAHVEGQYDGRGGHSTCYLGVWRLKNGDYLYGYSNQWETSTYPKDPAGLGRCCVWVHEKVVDTLFRTGGDKGETMALSHFPADAAFPPQPKVIDWAAIFAGG